MREIIESENFKRAVHALGGHRAVDEALQPIIEALYHRPQGFPSFKNKWVSFYYARTKPIRYVPALVVMFTIEQNGDVLLDHVEEDQDTN